MKALFFSNTLLLLLTFSTYSFAQITERQRPAEWDDLVYGGRFMDLFLPMLPKGPLTSDTWGAAEVKPRYIENGLEDNEWSYWGGNALLGEDGKYHLFVCRWPENAEKGHMAWPNSEVVHAIAENSFGPFKVVETIGKGHNPEIFQLNDGRFVLYVYKAYYLSSSLDGPWERKTFDFDPRDRKIVDGLSNMSFALREDGSIIMVCRGGGIWFSETGLSPYYQVTEERIYPPVDGRFEDPVIWKTDIQYHMIVNDWLGRIAWYLRSKDGINWKVDPGEAYMPGIAVYEDGTKEDWFKYERIKMLQDELGRATQAHFAVIDTIKWEDKKSDTHSSKHIVIPLTVGRQLTILNKGKIDESTEEIQVLIKAEKGFNPHEGMDINSLRFGASEEVNFGRGSKVTKTEKQGDDLLVIFAGAGNGLTADNFAAKLLGSTKEGKLLFGFARLPWVDYIQPALSAKLPEISNVEKGFIAEIEVQNFGQVNSVPTQIDLEIEVDGEMKKLASAEVPILKPFEKTIVKIKNNVREVRTGKSNVKISLYPPNQKPVYLHGEVKL